MVSLMPDPDPATFVDLAALRRRIRALERGEADVARRAAFPIGARALDDALPDGGLARGVLHEILPARAVWDDGPAAGFCLALLGRVLRHAGGPALWIARRQDLYPPGLSAFGVDPGHLLLTRASDETAVLWAMEEALRCTALAAVVAEAAKLDRTAARRLQLAAEAGRVTGMLLLRRHAPPRGREEPSAAETRWRIGALPMGTRLEEVRPVADLLGRPRWQVELLRVRGGHPTVLEVEWDDATGDFALAAPLRDGAAARPREGDATVGVAGGTGRPADPDSG